MEKILNRLNALKEKKVGIESDIMAQEAHPAPDALKIQELKKQKLAVKQEIEAIEATL